MPSPSDLTMRDNGQQDIGQLNTLRGLAIVLMIVNHAGISLVDWRLQEAEPFRAPIFIGSFAPVIFFFTTGFGIGISRRAVDLASFFSTLLKAALLIVADQFLFWKNSVPCGLDFLGFIAFSSVFTTTVALNKRPVRVCTAIIASVLFIRFCVGPWVRLHIFLPPIGEWIVGIRAVSSVSYPLSPWIIYPMLGFVMARRYRAVEGLIKPFLWPWATAVSAFAILIAILLWISDAHFFRWGTMNFAYFILSIGVIYFSIVAAWQLVACCPYAARLLSLRGIASLAAVPIHYALIASIVAAKISPADSLSMLAAFAGIATITIALSRLFASGVQGWVSAMLGRMAWAPFGGLVIVSGVLLWWMPQQSIAVFASFVIGQLSIAALLGIRNGPITALR